MSKSVPTKIILTGFMGTGKTAVGQELARRLGYTFVDTDEMVEKDQKKSIGEIFEKEGEEAFRSYEKQMVRKSLDQEKVVIATGGGAVTDPENLKLMKERCFLIGLAASPEVILERVSRTGARPLLKTKDQLETIKNLLSKRSPYYREAHRIIDTSGKGVMETVEEILKTFGNHTR